VLGFSLDAGLAGAFPAGSGEAPLCEVPPSAGLSAFSGGFSDFSAFGDA
jgi:hypothetical protein